MPTRYAGPRRPPVQGEAVELPYKKTEASQAENEIINAAERAAERLHPRANERQRRAMAELLLRRALICICERPVR